MLWPDPDPFHRHPRDRPAGCRLVEAVQEAQAALEREARQSPRRGDHRQGIRGHMGEGVGQHLDGVTSQQQRWRRRRQRHLRLEPRDPLRLIGPQAGAQPSGVIRVGHVNRIEVDADAGDDLGHLPGRDGPGPHDRRRHLHGR